ncbi:helix-turn-helix domain-containing protein [Actinophytocola oryzae]|uniref:Protein-tyrosine-phosphatase n=1 Tax=Actinophytocola oryzae TaxID=502181 RepID=A0A4R7V8W2_9PSEU|nr:helix-turn-helix domain-containing protein [Actinophytocola oryzae]TDV45345.1 protein-tyrosine-phosphatase [Actinophytocola oryzae]
MNVEWSSEVVARARLHAALGEPARLAIVDRLLLGDASPSELGRALGIGSNLLAHHVKLLEQAGVIERSRSEGDHRRTYLRLRPAALAGLVPAGVVRAARVVFVCTHNSARSQLAAALWRRRSQVPAASAGTQPAARVHPLAVATAREHGLSLAQARTAHVHEVLQPDDLVVAVCDNAHEHLPDHTGADAVRLHWSVPDPAPVGTEDAFDRAFRDLADRVDRLAPAVQTGGKP